MIPTLTYGVVVGKGFDMLGEVALSSREMVADNLGALTVFDVPHRDAELHKRKTNRQYQFAHKIRPTYDSG